MGISQSIPAMEHRPEQEERMEERPEAEARMEEASSGVEPTAGTMVLEQQLEQQPVEDASTASRRYTEVLELPKVDRGAAPATPAIRPGDSSAPATGTKSKTERKQEKKAARKEEKRNKKAEKSARKAEKAEAEKSEETPSKTPVRRKLDIAMEKAGSIESVLLLEREYKALQRDPSHRPNFYFLIDRIISNLRHIPRTDAVQYSAPRQGKKKGLSLRSFEKKKKKQKKVSQQKQLSQKQKTWTKVLPQGSESSTSWSRRRKLWKKKMPRSRRSSKMRPEGLERLRKPNVGRKNSEQKTPSSKYQWQLRKERSLKPGSNGRLQNW